MKQQRDQHRRAGTNGGAIAKKDARASGIPKQGPRMPSPKNESDLLGHREVHEAGHVVIAEVLGWPQNGVTVDPKAETGDTAFIPSDFHAWVRGNGHKQKVAAVYARILYAGRAAEIALLGKDCGGHTLDYERAREAIGWSRNGIYPAFGGSEDGTFVRQSAEEVVRRTERRLEKQATALVKRHKMAIAMVADALRIKATLTRDDVKALIEDAKRRRALAALTLWPEANPRRTSRLTRGRRRTP
jgi:hypothetical protein